MSGPKLDISVERPAVEVPSRDGVWACYEPGPVGVVRVEGDWEEVQLYMRAVVELRASRAAAVVL